MTPPRVELGTHTVLRCCHNQLDHRVITQIRIEKTLIIFQTQKKFLKLKNLIFLFFLLIINKFYSINITSYSYKKPKSTEQEYNINKYCIY